MRNFEYKSPRVHNGQLRTPVHFYEKDPNAGPEPGTSPGEKLFTAWAKVDEVFLRDMELAKYNGTASDITVVIRDPQAEFIPTNQHYIEIDAPEYRDRDYVVKEVQPDLQERSFVNVIAEVAG